jgi:hypothetical protein
LQFIGSKIDYEAKYGETIGSKSCMPEFDITGVKCPKKAKKLKQVKQ